VEVGSNYVRARHPLQNDYAAGATFQSTTLFAAIDTATSPAYGTGAAWLSLLQNLSDLIDTTPDFRVRWSVVVGGATVVLYTFFDVVRSAIAHGVDASDINARLPGFIDLLPIEYRAEDGRPLIDAAWSAVRADFAAMGVDVNAVRENEVVDELVILRTLRSLAEGGIAPPGMDKTLYLQRATENYNRFLERHFQGSLRHLLQYQLETRPPGFAVPPPRVPWSK
jgi:hypothetical protein